MTDELNHFGSMEVFGLSLTNIA
ncbi:MAG: hypothetical protein JWP41_1889, partial [Ramlibacter sp.]|nr:hypothetical protein [Ramlibacter sp.]